MSEKEIIHAEVDSSHTIILTFNHEMTAEHLAALKADTKRIEKLIENVRAHLDHGVSVLVDISHFPAEYVAGAVDLMVDLCRQDKLFVKKTASFGGSLKARMIGETIAALASRDNIKLFDKRTEAEKWLGE